MGGYEHHGAGQRRHQRAGHFGIAAPQLILPALNRGLIATVNVQDMVFRRSFYIIYHRDKFLTDAAQAFLALCRNYEADHPLPESLGLFE